MYDRPPGNFSDDETYEFLERSHSSMHPALRFCKHPAPTYIESILGPVAGIKMESIEMAVDDSSIKQKLICNRDS